MTPECIAETWLVTRAKVAHDLLQRGLLSWCRQAQAVIDGRVEGGQVFSDSSLRCERLTEQLLADVTWLLENMHVLRPSAVLFSDLVREEGSYVAQLDERWSEHYDIDALVGEIALALGVVKRNHQTALIAIILDQNEDDTSRAKALGIYREALNDLLSHIERLPAHLDTV